MNNQEPEKSFGEKIELNSGDKNTIDLIQSITKTAFTTLAVASVRGFKNLSITEVQRLAYNVYSVKFVYLCAHPTENNKQGEAIEYTSTEGQGLYIHQLSPALYLDAYTMANFVQDAIHNFVKDVVYPQIQDLKDLLEKVDHKKTDN